MQELLAFGGQLRAKVSEDGAGRNSGLPVHEFLDLLFDDGFYPGNFRLARFLVLLHDFGQVVDVIQIRVVEIADAGRDVARDAEINHQQSAIAAAPHGALDRRARQNRLRARHGSYEQVRPFKRTGQVLPRDDFPAKSRGQIHGVLHRAIQDAQLFDSAVAQMPHNLLAGRPRPDNQRAMIIQLAKDALGQFYARERYRNRPRADLRLVANALAHLQSALEHAVENWAGCAVVASNPVGLANLPEDFGFPQQHGIEPGRDAKQMVHRAAVPVPVQRTIQGSRRQLVKRCEEQLHRAGAIRGQLAGDAVKFAPVAGGKYQRFIQNSARTQLVGGLARLLHAERDPLAPLDRGRAVIQSDEDNFHLRIARLNSLVLLVHTQSEVTVKV